ncbi:TauD/TfdA family dioxygenase [Vitiosangium sp. GDMCC 1.1324]|uniref:TauD/TfdA family dioxygenase n=1 Tax=Vitiosangium sp. (strain GDMCC 1.1324) TaxID=2138576 RepID=UPI000D3B20A4|nr:TauD/TfdA family dioxygenase [Vitiosangium sp. GDMCC 1.1324]PTL76231.1 taurine catabolism dioxygenase TauD [Vitiosangium sp. GDMCC 1.1324]
MYGPDMTRYGSGHGVLIQAPEGESLDTLTKDGVLASLEEAGFILFRQFNTHLDAFSHFVKRMSSRISLDPARQFHGSVAQKVDAGFDAVGLHCENGNSPFLPDLCWFYCEKAASAGSQTTVCDGYRVWNALSPATRELFLAQPIVYSRRVAEARWKSFVFHLLEGRKPLEDIELGDLLALVRNSTQTRIEPEADGAIHYAFQVPAVHGTLFSEQKSFANSILGPSFNYERPRITFADGSSIPDEVQEEIRVTTETLTEDIGWQDGDVVLIDNTRVMHGRRAIQDPHRTIYNALSYL